ncbi:protein of unknown function [Shimia gijangensis]|uniref:Uncharacterized protein n=1 Tax=Shimia gijangensis TaxID=1470563 RepID=A0A1M6QTS4_9RHOB|nr:DUF4169 family protein [Shimia gijangensis]SHK23624.1 protein of unknown function [Shimia gijangensis]
MAQPVNLNRFKKQKARAKKKARADENSMKFGRTGLEKQREKSELDKTVRHIDGHKRDDT